MELCLRVAPALLDTGQYRLLVRVLEEAGYIGVAQWLQRLEYCRSVEVRDRVAQARRVDVGLREQVIAATIVTRVLTKLREPARTLYCSPRLVDAR